MRLDMMDKERLESYMDLHESGVTLPLDIAIELMAAGYILNTTEQLEDGE